jgi:hypothetical protein
MSPAAALRAVKALHTLVWAFFAGCVVAIPSLAWRGRLGGAVVASGVVLAEVIVLALNRMRCPLTAVAARYTAERRDNFDIYLPLWLARRNKVVFGALYVFGLLTVAARWVGDQSR